MFLVLIQGHGHHHFLIPPYQDQDHYLLDLGEKVGHYLALYPERGHQTKVTVPQEEAWDKQHLKI